MQSTIHLKMEDDSEPCTVPPPKKNPSGKFVESSQKMKIINLYKDIKTRNPGIKYKPMLQVLSQQTGIGRLTISKTIAEYKSTGAVTSPNKKRPRLNIFEKMSEADICAIRKTIHEFWFRREIPNTRKILEAVNNNADLPTFSESSLYRLLKRMDFKFITCARNSALIEKDHVVAWRQNYIQQIQAYRAQGRPIYYVGETLFIPIFPSLTKVENGIGETFVKVEDCGEKILFDTIFTCPRNVTERRLSTGVTEPSDKGKHLIIGHVVSSDGFVPGTLLCFEAKKNSLDYRNEMNGDIFFDWFRSFLPMLQDGAIIVIDNAAHHSVKIEKYPTLSWTKNDIITWLVGKGEKVNPHYVKAQLIGLTGKHKRPENNYVIDEYAKQHGHIVLRLPPYHSELNPLELAWTKLKDYITARNITYKLADIQQLVNEAIENVSTESWQNLICHIIDEETKLCQLDHITDDILDNSGDWLDQSDDSDASNTENL
ncbi:uncharacterized protein LOC108625801 [Ceratina calcarata]|uniref:Uncharacterized protein LOC108625801 n=1 Tax=Ceratina calcarata TaxID=156304 RepID=A0AAJ7N7K8_9HYME|nr:uncharacterized protein LOC108625801 [Ceratina calcarata]